MRKTIALITLLGLIANLVYAQSVKNVSGRVIGDNGQAIYGASVVVKGTNTGIISDANGNFVINAATSAVLEISYIGFFTQQVPVGGKSHLIITLVANEQSAESVVVVAYGKQKKETVTGAIATVSSATLARIPSANITNMLVGNVPGIIGVQNTGEPGFDAANIRIRGLSTFVEGNQLPIVIVDGVETTVQALNAIDANEIDNVSVLKDASSTAVYGVRGANGVVIVTTKRGKTGKPRLNFTYNHGLTQLASRLKFLSSYDYLMFRNEAVLNDGDISQLRLIATKDELWKFSNNRDYTPDEVAQLNITEGQQAKLLNSPAIYYTSHDYFSEMLGNLSQQLQANLNISGGTDNVKYFTSVGYLNQGGTFKNPEYAGHNINSTFDRYNFRSNFDFNMLKYFTLTVDMATQFSKNGSLQGDSKDGDPRSIYARYKNIMGRIYFTTPFSGPGFVDGKLINNFVASTNPLSQKGSYGASPVSDLFSIPYMTTYNTNFNSTVRLKHSMEYLTKGLSLSGAISYNDVYRKAIQIYPSVPMYIVTRDQKDPNNLVFLGGSIAPVGIADNTNRYKWRRMYYELSANYTNTFGRHDVGALYLLNAQKTYAPDLELNVPNGLIGMVGRITYQYAKRYMAEINMGYNGSENFPEHKRFGLFPAFSAGWIATNENFIPKNDILTHLKVRGSYGEVGNDKIGARFLYMPNRWGNGTGTWGGYYFGNSDGSTKNPYYQGVRETFVGNPNVTWERSRKQNIGLEANFFRNRLTFVGDIFSEKRDNILWSSGIISGTVGFTPPYDNIGKTSNKGYELELGWADNTPTFEYGARFTASYTKNRIDYMAEPSNPYPWMNQTGYSIGQYRGYITNGFYNTVEEAAHHPYTTIDGNRVQPGDLRYVDVTGDGVVDDKDIVPIGFSNWPRYSFSSLLNLGYKGFKINVLFIGTAQGSMMLEGTYIRNPFYNIVGAAMQWQYDGRWTPEKAAQGAEISYPRASLRTNLNVNGMPNSGFWLRSTDFIRLKNAEISYAFPQKYTKRLGMTGLRVYVNGNNLYTWTQLMDGIDPEQAASGAASNGYVYPMTRVFNFGINIQF